MQTCVDVRSEATDTTDAAALTDILSLYHTNHTMKITKDESASAKGGLKNSEDAFNYISSMFIQPQVLGKTKDITAASSIEIDGGSSYIPIGPGDTAGGAASDGELIFGKPLACPPSMEAQL